MFGALLFGIWVFYLQVAVIKGCLKFGLNLLIFKVGGRVGNAAVERVRTPALAASPCALPRPQHRPIGPGGKRAPGTERARLPVHRSTP